MTQLTASDVQVSIIIVNYNAGPLLTETVQAALSSTIKVEVLIADNGSKDNSIAYLKNSLPDPRIKIFEQGLNLGFAKANNRLIPFAKGQYLLFLNPDCLLTATTLEEMLAIIDENPLVAMAGPLIVNPDGSEQRGCRRAIPTPWQAFIRAFGLHRLTRVFPSLGSDFVWQDQALPTHAVVVPAISGAFMSVKRSALTSVGVWDEGYFLHCEDLDWCQRFQQQHYQILFIPSVRVTHIKGACSQSRPLFVQWHMHKGMSCFYRKFFKQQYPQALWWLVVVGVWFRFTLFVVSRFLQMGFDKIKLLSNKLRSYFAAR